MESDWHLGILVGKTSTSHEHILLTQGGVLRCRSVRRLELEERHNKKIMEIAREAYPGTRDQPVTVRMEDHASEIHHLESLDKQSSSRWIEDLSLFESETRISSHSVVQNTTARDVSQKKNKHRDRQEPTMPQESQARHSKETVGGDPVRRRLVHKTRPERERPQLNDQSEPADKHRRAEMINYDAPGLGGEQTKLTLRPQEEYDTEDDAKDIEIDDLNMTEVLKLAKSEGLDSTAVERAYGKKWRVFRILVCIRKSVRRMSKNEVSRSVTRGRRKMVEWKPDCVRRNARTLRKTICMCRHLEQRQSGPCWLAHTKEVGSWGW